MNSTDYQVQLLQQRVRELETRMLQLEDRLVFNQQLAEDNSCSGCPPGQVCRTFACGRLKLPLDHPLRNPQ
jgi:hypothetical protein